MNQDLYNFRTLRVYLYYRLILSVLLFLMHEAKLTNNALGSSNPEMFYWSSMFYMSLAILSLSLLFDRYSFRSTYKVGLLLAIDLVALLLMIHSSGGIISGLGYLLVITAAIASMFLKGQLALAFAAVVSLSIIGETIYTYLDQNDNTVRSLFGAGVLGFLVFITAITFQYLSDRIRSSSREAEEKSEYASQLVQLAQHIVTRMRTGIMVLNEQNDVELINDSARQLLDLPRYESYIGHNISTISNLEGLVTHWQNAPTQGKAEVHTTTSQREIRVNFAQLESKNGQNTILYIEDYRGVMQHAQQLKLASLGRLTASIAHEIRNPLGAISHAAQLLSESKHLDPTDTRFIEIILQHSKRVNQIIENVTSLSKRKEPKAELIDLHTWIPAFINEYCTAKSCDIRFNSGDNQHEIKMDPSHLRQILTNLFDNGLRYSMEANGLSSVSIRTGLSENDDTTYIEVIDQGKGVPEDKVENIFEPFFTTDDRGSGLGLYISRELCEINQATLSYAPTPDNESCFKINFPHHQRMI